MGGEPDIKKSVLLILLSSLLLTEHSVYPN
jgi:hypothetical protein